MIALLLKWCYLLTNITITSLSIWFRFKKDMFFAVNNYIILYSIITTVLTICFILKYIISSMSSYNSVSFSIQVRKISASHTTWTQNELCLHMNMILVRKKYSITISLKQQYCLNTNLHHRRRPVRYVLLNHRS